MAFLLFLVMEHCQLRAVTRCHLGRFDQLGLQMFVLRVVVLEFYMIREFALFYREFRRGRREFWRDPMSASVARYQPAPPLVPVCKTLNEVLTL